MTAGGIALAKATEWLLYISIVGTLLLVTLLARRGLYRVYRWFFIYQVFNAVESCVALVPVPRRYMIGRYGVSQTIMTALAALVVLEIYRLSLQERRALARFGRNMVGYALGISFSASLIRLFFYGGVPADQVVLHYTLAVEGVVDSTILIFLCLMGAFLAWFPVQMKKSLVAYFLGFVFYFSALWVILLLAIRHTAERDVATVNVIAEVVRIGCIIFWIKGMRKKDDDNTTTTGHRWNPEEMQRLKTQLDEINAGLERLAR
jgi:hypothetical protein